MNGKLVKVKLLNNGMKGMEYQAEDPIIKENVIIQGFIKKNYPIPLPSDIIQLIQRMKRYLLHMSGHWRKEYDQYIDKGELLDISDPDTAYYDLIKLFEGTRIEELSRFKGKYNVLGFYMNDWKFPVKISITGITIDTGYEDYEKLDRGMKHIFDAVTGFIDEKQLRKMDSKQYMLDLWAGKEEMLQRLDGLSDEQIDDLQAKVLEEKGFIVLKQEEEENENPIEETVDATPVKTPVAEMEKDDMDIDEKIEI